ncbi:MAG: alpha/beta fold hydrolase [Candidatus Sericytochromatia bacterium]|nr:alpha/beta fold hydrolase [Candidatus Sericytochromatia bacterium]
MAVTSSITRAATRATQAQGATATRRAGQAALRLHVPKPGHQLDEIRRTLGHLQAEQRRHAVQELQGVVAAERGMLLQKGAETRVMLHDMPTGKGTAVLLHGWSAAPWQYDEMAPELYKLGYDVYIPRLPGHGLRTAAGKADPSQLPKAGESHLYRDFADTIYDQVKRLGGPIHLVGLSGGGNVALDIATRHPDVARVVALAPFLNIPGKAEDVLPRVIDAADTVLLGKSVSVLDQIPWNWGKDAVRTVGYHEFKLGNITSIRRYGMAVGDHLAKNRVPTQYVTTATDAAASSKAIGRLFERGAPAQTGWFEFPAAANVPHPMIAPPNNPDPASRQRIIGIVKDFLETGRPVGTGPQAR